MRGQDQRSQSEMIVSGRTSCRRPQLPSSIARVSEEALILVVQDFSCKSYRERQHQLHRFSETSTEPVFPLSSILLL
jgi:hypothetical protein